ncbi:hypothetical protein evm_000536 [Chilo suppressalis]|nr:hypothetical protein evm_000536 [Chilo suppressalis]
MLEKFYSTVKYSLVSVNFLFVITGIIILAIGSSVQRAYNGYHSFLSERLLSLPAFCIATGIIIFIIAFAGFYGAYRENYLMIMAYAGLMVLMFIFVMSACIAGYVLKRDAVALVQTELYETMPMYKQDYIVTRLWDEVQEDFRCCGVKNASDWLPILDTQNSTGLPVSCCELPVGAVQILNCTVEATTLYRGGCSDAFGSWVQSHIGTIGVAGIFLIILQALAVGASIWLAKVSRDEQAAYP